ncbi:MAG: Ribonuclease BN, partial [uncultured Blastococcus sp.]
DWHQAARERRGPHPGAGRGEGRPPGRRGEGLRRGEQRRRYATPGSGPAAPGIPVTERVARPPRGEAHRDPVGRLEADPEAGVGREQGRQHADHRRRRGLLRLPVHLPGADRPHLDLRPGGLAGDGGAAGRGPLRPAARRRGKPHRGAADGDRRQQRQRAEHQPRRLHPRRALERVGRGGQRDHRGQHRLRRGGGPGFRQAQADLARADPRRDRVRPDHLRSAGRRPVDHRGARARRRRHDPGPGGPLGAAAGRVLRRARRPLPHRSRPGRPPAGLGQPRLARRHGRLGGGERRVRALRQQLRVLRQDLRHHRRRHRADAVALPDLLPRAPRRGDQLRGRAPDGARHHHGRAPADGEPRRQHGRHAAGEPRAEEGRQRPDAEV